MTLWPYLLIDLDYLNTYFSSQTRGYNLSSTPPSSASQQLQNGHEEESTVAIMNPKPGSDNALPSPNGIIAINLILLSSYLDEPAYLSLAKRTIDAFAIEIIQHPFLFVSMLSAMVLEAVGVKSIVALGDIEVHHFSGFGRTVIRLQDKKEQRWLMERNQLLKGMQLRDGEKGRVMICEAGTCRELKHGELDAGGGQS